MVALAIGAYLLINWFVTTDRERVEAEVGRLVALARQGGEDAAAEILDALAEDYRGRRPFDREDIAAYLRRYVAPRRVRKLSTGDFTTLWKGDEILVPILRIDAATENAGYTLILTVRFANRDGAWKVVDITRWRIGR